MLIIGSSRDLFKAAKDQPPAEASDVLAAKAKALLNDPEKGKGLSYGEALDIVAKENPELTQRYLTGDVQMVKSKKQVMREASDLLCLKIKELLDDPERGKGLSYGDAMNIVAKENPELTNRYLTGKP
jgi:uncharacterized protein YoaH (UPF0181 family)